jgi:micrococcal nuclease
MGKGKEKYIIALIVLIIVFFAVNYQFLDKYLVENFEEPKTALIDSVVDGDTIKSGDLSMRLLGINSPEKKQDYYEEAKKFLQDRVLNKTIRIKYGKDLYDKYSRLLVYVFVDDVNINKKLIEEGLANPYFPSGKDKHYYEFIDAWQECLDKGINMCEQSNEACSSCIEIVDLDDFGHALRNNCKENCSIDKWIIKNQGRDMFVFRDIILEPGEEQLFEIEVSEYFEDTLYLRDSEGKLVAWKNINNTI